MMIFRMSTTAGGSLANIRRQRHKSSQDFDAPYLWHLEIVSSGAGVEEEDILKGREKSAQIRARETDFQKRKDAQGPLTPTRADAFNTKGQTYRELTAAREIEREEERVWKMIPDFGVTIGSGRN